MHAWRPTRHPGACGRAGRPTGNKNREGRAPPDWPAVPRVGLYPPKHERTWQPKRACANFWAVVRRPSWKRNSTANKLTTTPPFLPKI